MSETRHADLRINFWGAFASPEVEAGFRQSQHTQERRFALLVLSVGLFSILAFIPSDARLLGPTPVFRTLLGLRTFQALAEIVTISLLWRGVRPLVADRLLFFWAMSGWTVTLCIGYTRPTAFFPGYLITSLFLLLLLYFVTPLPLEYQTIVTLLAGTGNTYLVLQHPDMSVLMVRAVAFGYLMTFAIGLYSSWNMHHLKREQFAARRRLEDALAEVKTLQGILPICSHCKNVRNDDGYWQHVEVYVREHSDAQFSHGICPDCAQTYFPGVLERRRRGDI